MSNDTAELPARSETRRTMVREGRKERITASNTLPSRNRYRTPPSNPGQDMASIFTQHGRDIYCVLDSALTCLSLSENWLHVSGFTAEQSVGEAFKDHIAPDHLRKVKQYLAGGTTNETPLRFQIKDNTGHWRWCELRCTDYAENKGIYQCLLSDVTELVCAQGKLEKAKLEAELANKSRSEFLANMSHELRTPLNAILGFTQMIENGMYGDIGHPKYHDYIGSIQESGSTLLSKINDLLEIANIDSGQMALNEAPADLVTVIRQAIEFHSHHAFSEQVTLRDRLPAEPLIVSVDRIRILQVITNLLSNAIRYNRKDGTVDIYCETRKDGGVNIVIHDNGGGIPPSHLQNILSAFGQDNSFFARSRDCVGLGLALAKEIVKLHNGRIEIDSEVNKGTLLTIRLPKERTIKQSAMRSHITLPINPEPETVPPLVEQILEEFNGTD